MKSTSLPHNLFCVIGLLFFLQENLAHAASFTYSYDSLNRLTNTTYETGAEQQFSYDPAGNRTVRVSVNPLTISTLGNQNTTSGIPTPAIPFTVNNPSLPSAGLTVWGKSSNSVLVAKASLVFAGNDTSRTLTITPVSGQIGTATITIVVSDGSVSAASSFVLTVSSAITTRGIFYNDSAWDSNDPTGNSADDNALALDKVALRPGGIASAANYTSYSRGMNGIVLDIAGLPDTLTAADFTFKVGNNNTPSSWAAAPAPASITVRPGAGAGGSARVTIIWPDNAIKNQWLEVTVKATSNTGLAIDDVFYFGNAIGETGNSTINAVVNGVDQARVRANPRTSSNPASIDSPFDINRDGFVNGLDEAKVRLNGTTSSTALQLIDLTALASGVAIGLNPLSASLPSPTVESVLLRILANGDGTVTLFASAPDAKVQRSRHLAGPWESMPLANEGSGRWRVRTGDSTMFFRLAPK